MSAQDELIGAVTPVAEAFDRLGVAWYIGGSIASGAFGEFRATNAVDVVADLRLQHASPGRCARRRVLRRPRVDSLAIRRRASFNAVHFDTMLKIDVFVVRDRPYDQEALRRRMARKASTAVDAPSSA